MRITKIKNREQHKHYCDEASRLVAIDPEVDSIDGLRLQLLAVYIEEYERKLFCFEDTTKLVERSNNWAAEVWDESDLPESEQSLPETLSLAKAAGSCGYTHGWRDAMKQLKEIWSCAREIEQIDLGGDVLIEGRHYRWTTFEDWKKENGRD